jgi:hypothetical protein
MAKNNPNVREILKNKTKSAVKDWARKNGWKIRDTGKEVWIGDAKCTFDSNDKLLMVE